MSLLRERYIEHLQLGGYSPCTVELYTAAVAELSRRYGGRPLRLSTAQIRSYLHELMMRRKLSPKTVNLRISALKHFYRFMGIEPNPMDKIPRVRLDKKLPLVLTREEVHGLLDAVETIRNKAAVSLLYSAGLRLSECIHLHVSDIDSTQMLVRVREGKGRKERFTTLSEHTLSLLRAHARKHRPQQWLFPGKTGPVHSSVLNHAIKRAAQRAGIHKPVSPHTLRHCFATHLLEQGVQLQVIQKLLGHANVRTTFVYTHVSQAMVLKVVSPLDLDTKEADHA